MRLLGPLCASCVIPFSFAFLNIGSFMSAVEPDDKSLEVMRKFSEQYARRSGTYFCVDKGVTAVVIKVWSLDAAREC